MSHSSGTATQKWFDLIGGAWNLQVVIGEGRAIYAAWELGLGSVWYLLNPQTRVQAWKEKGWLDATVATSIQRKGVGGRGLSALDAAVALGKPVSGNGAGVVVGADAAERPTTAMGNKWQQAGAWAVGERGAVVWGEEELTADDVLDFEAGVKALGL